MTFSPSFEEPFNVMEGCSGCGPSCDCGPCKAQYHGLGERYIPEEKEEDDSDSDKTAGPLFGEVPFGEAPSSRAMGPPPPSSGTSSYKIVVKSYIARIGSAAGSMRSIPMCVVTDPLNLKLKGLALATDRMMSENPLVDLQDKKYRLYSERTFSVTCRGGMIASVVPSGFTTDVGLECPASGVCLSPPPLTITGATAGPAGPAVFRFSWMAVGRPPLVAEPAFQLVCPRTSRFIWHRITGEIDCSDPGPVVRVKLSGSQFPSHRVFINGRLTTTVPQGGFSNLWIADPADFSRVR